MNKIKVLKEAIKVLKRQAGRKCKDFTYACFVCDTYIAIAIMESWIDVMEDLK